MSIYPKTAIKGKDGVVKLHMKITNCTNKSREESEDIKIVCGFCSSFNVVKFGCNITDAENIKQGNLKQRN